MERASGNDATLTRVQYTYDLAGNRVRAVRTPRPSGAGANDTRQEQETSKVLNSEKWQRTMATMVRQNPEVAQKLADALLENAKFVEKTAPGYLAKMKGALSKVKFSWMPKGVKFRVR